MSSIEGLPHIETVPNDIEVALTRPVETVEEVLDSFEEVGPLLDDAGLPQAVSFWAIYKGVTYKVHNALHNGVFQRPDDVAHTLPIFYNMGRNPLLCYVRGDYESIDPEWGRALRSKSVIKADPGRQFLSCMNSHITTDLGRALYASKVSDEYKPDFTIMVGQMLEEVAHEQAATYIPLKQPALRGLMLASCLKYIDVAREQAWRDGKRLQAASDEQEAARIVERIKRNSVRQGRALHHASGMMLRAATQLDNVATRFNPPTVAA